MYAPAGVKTSKDFPIPDKMKAWVLGNPGELIYTDKAVPVPKKAEVLVRIDAVAICATDLDNIYHGPPALIEGGKPFNKNWTPGHEYMGTVVALGPGVDEYKIGQRISVEIHAGCGQCKRCREGMYTSCHNYGLNYGDVDKGHRANGFTTDGGFCEYQVNNINTLVAIPDDMSDEEATLVVTAGTAMYALTELGGLVAGESVCVTGPGPIGLLTVAVAKALGAQPVILTGTRDNRLQIGKELGADHVINIRKTPEIVAEVKKLTPAARASTTSWNVRRPQTRSRRRCAWSTAAARFASPLSPMKRSCQSMSRTSCATISTFTAFAARARARRTAPRPTCDRSASMPRRFTLIPFRSRTCRKRSATPRTASTTRSRWW